ncbi:unnamed protein product [Vicia faba]|uniref:EMC1 first beta-propeller domain-containing protein n=1 Tax=Vicia faba TaxID=3906 RepID=A0AAV0ZNH2_VICFA|nr:unnamed protein product [Vicia faba]
MGATNANTPNVPGSTDGKPFLIKDVNVESPGVYSSSRPVQSGGQLASGGAESSHLSLLENSTTESHLCESFILLMSSMTDRSHGFRALMVMEDHSLLLVQKGEIVWSREDGLSSVVDVTTSELPVEKDGVSVAKVEQNLFESSITNCYKKNFTGSYQQKTIS